MNTPSQQTDEVVQISIDDICPSPFQGRKNFDSVSLDELSDSIREKGILQPITVRAVEGGKTTYELVMGERRWRASKIAGFKTIRSLVRELSDEEAREIVLVENVQREGLTPMEEARSVKDLVEANDGNQAEAARKIGKKPPYISNKLALLELPNAVQDMLDAKIINEAAARVILEIEGEEHQLQAAKLAEKLNLTATQLRARMQTHIKSGGSKNKKNAGPSGERKPTTFKKVSSTLVEAYEALEGFDFEELDGSEKSLKNREMLKRQTALLRQSLARTETALLRDPSPGEEKVRKGPPKLRAGNAS